MDGCGIRNGNGKEQGRRLVGLGWVDHLPKEKGDQAQSIRDIFFSYINK